MLLSLLVCKFYLLCSSLSGLTSALPLEDDKICATTEDWTHNGSAVKFLRAAFYVGVKMDPFEVACLRCRQRERKGQFSIRGTDILTSQNVRAYAFPGVSMRLEGTQQKIQLFDADLDVLQSPGMMNFDLQAQTCKPKCRSFYETTEKQART